MKLLCASSDLGELGGLVKRLVRIGIPCAVCKDSSGSHLSVWIQQDCHFPMALRISVERDKPRPLPPWANLLDLDVPAKEDPAVAASEGCTEPGTEAKNSASVVVVQSKGATLTGTAEATALRSGRQQRRTKRQGEGRCGIGPPQRL